MIPYTTPSFVISIDGDIDLTEATDVYVTIVQRDLRVTKNGSDVAISEDGKTVSIWLTQEESSRFAVGTAQAQVNWVYVDAVDGEIRRASTEPLTVQVGTQLYEQVIT